jgi:transposase
VPQETDAEKIARLERKIEQLERENERLRRALEEALRSGKRQAAPFSKGAPKANPNKPGRKPGSGYGRAAYRAVPPRVDETLEAPLPRRCPCCGGAVRETDVVDQYQMEIPKPRVHCIRFRVHRGCCRRCGRPVQGRHPRQTSDALGAAGSQLGPRAVALATELNKGLGLPYGKVTNVLQEAFALPVTRSGLCQAIARAGRKSEPTYQGLIQQLNRSLQVTPDETGWKVAGELWWLWAFATVDLTVYSIQPGRGFEQSAAILRPDFAGGMARDGWGVYRRYEGAVQQSCLNHLSRRCRELIGVARPAAARFPHRVQQILQQALELRDRRDGGAISVHGLAVVRGRLEARLDRLLEARYRLPANERFANHLWRERNCLFTFLYCPGLDATNYRAEQAIRPAVVTRKVWGGNRTPAGAHTQGILASVLRTCHQRKLSAQAVLIRLLCAAQPATLHLTASDLSPPRHWQRSPHPTIPRRLRLQARSVQAR